MTSFSIDDVRDTIRRDVQRLLSCIIDDAAELLNAQRGSGLGAWEARLQEIGEAGHALFGTTALVAAESLSSSAALIEQLAARAEHELARAERHRQRASHIVALCAEGAQEMRAMLDLELEHRSEEAQLIALAWQGKLNDGVPSSLPAPNLPAAVMPVAASLEDEPFDFREEAVDAAPPPTAPTRPPLAGPAASDDIDEGWGLDSASQTAPTSEPDAPDVDLEFRFEPRPVPAIAAASDEFDFDDQPLPDPATPGLADELQQIFVQEAREHLVALQGHLNALAADHSDLAVSSQIERLFHTLKGASATVGLDEVSRRAAELQQRMERVVEQGQLVDKGFVISLVHETNQLLESAGLPQVAITVARVPARRTAKTVGSEERTVFIDEATEICRDAQRGIEALVTAPPERQQESLEVLGRAFHRLKGSALVVGEEAIAEQAATLEHACESEPAPTTAELTRGLMRIMVSLGLGSTLLSPEPELAADAEARAVFAEEARELLAEARALLREYAESSGSRMDDLRIELGRVFHRLKGSAAVVAEEKVALEAGLLRRLCEETTAGLPSPVSLKVGLTRLAGLLGVGDEEPKSQLTFESSGPVRESVQVAAEPELWEAFVQECSELLNGLDQNILALEESDSPKDQIQSLMRGYHTLKGVVNTIGLTPTGRIIHRVEDFLEGLLTSPILPAPSSVASFLLQVQVEVRRNLKQAKQGFVETSLARLDAGAARVLAGRRVSAATSKAFDDSRGSQRERSTRDTGASGPGTPWMESASDSADRRYIRVATERLDSLMNLAGELVVSRSRLLSRVRLLRGIQQELSRTSRRLVESVESFREEHEFANLDGRRQLRDVAVGPAWSAWSSSAKPDLIVTEGSGGKDWSGFGELELDRYEGVHILSRSLAEITGDVEEMYVSLGQGLATLTDDSEAFDTIVTGIQGEITRARMVPVETLFTRLRLPARDAATRESKSVRVLTEGEEVNIDKTIADALFQPMLHLVRNSVVHGIEGPARRESLGKPSLGTVILAARQESGQIVIEVRDDGRGLDLARLRSRGAALGLVSPDTPLDDPVIKDLVFVPGLSTEESAGAVAGRGVGCDVVRRIVERLNGSIRVETASGKGTAFVVTLPLTLAITKALIVEQGGQALAIPLYFAERILDAGEHEVVESAGVRRVKLDGAFARVKQMGRLLGAEDVVRERGPILVLRVGAQRLLVQVDAVVGQEEIVVKPVGELLSGHPLLAGVTIRGTGELVLILDVPGIADAARGTEEARKPVLAGAVPADLTLEQVASASAPEPGPVLAQATKGAPRVLFVDDSLSVRKVAEGYLKGIGVDVTLAVDGIDALAKLREGHFDVVFTDLEMPRMHGYELIRELRFLPAYRELPIIVVTSRSGQKHQDQARALGATEYLTKPFTAQHLAGALERWSHYQRSAGSESQ